MFTNCRQSLRRVSLLANTRRKDVASSIVGVSPLLISPLYLTGGQKNNKIQKSIVTCTLVSRSGRIDSRCKQIIKSLHRLFLLEECDGKRVVA